MKGVNKTPDEQMLGARLLFVIAPYYKEIAENLRLGAEAAANAAKAKVIDYVYVPGAFEIPAAIMHASCNHDYDGYVALGCVIRGETSHYEHICTESARGLMDISMRESFCIGNGILTVENMAQAEERADPARLDKGGEAARACLAMLAIRRRFRGAMG